MVSAAGGSYEYEKLRSALMAIVPSVKRDDRDENSTGSYQQQNGKNKTYYGNKHGQGGRINKVNMVDEEAEDDANLLDEGGSMVGDGDHVDDNENPDDLEKQAQVLMTQASKRRAEIEKGRGYQQKESAEERSKRIKEMKSRMACSACRAHGKVVYGHWHDDRECQELNAQDNITYHRVFFPFESPNNIMKIPRIAYFHIVLAEFVFFFGGGGHLRCSFLPPLRPQTLPSDVARLRLFAGGKEIFENVERSQVAGGQVMICAIGSINSYDFHIIGDKLINPIT